ncbi:parB-like protein [Clostridium sp. CAG:594]|jgi:ParB family chromosome partitioning protein|nr:parB-like protein [Clostridium sp. CAG:594]
MKEETNSKRRALGMGLEQLFNSEMLDFDQVEEKIVEETPKDEIVEIPINELMSNPYQPRKVFDEEALKELSESIKEHGVFQPIIVKKSVKGYNIIAGERRTKASELAGLKTVPAIVRDFSDEEMMQVALLENLQREDLSAIEEAKAYKSIIESLRLTQDELAKRLGKSRSHITNMLGLLRLPLSVQDMVLYGKISMGHARVLSKLENSEQIEDLANKVISENLSVRDLEVLTNESSYVRSTPSSKPRKSKEYKYVEDAMKEKLGTKVAISGNKIKISFVTKEDLNRILEILNIEVE